MVDTDIPEKNKRKADSANEGRLEREVYDKILESYSEFAMFTGLYDQVSFLAKYLRSLSRNDETLQIPKNSKDYLANVSRNLYSKKLHDDFLKLTAEVKEEIAKTYTNKNNQYEYYVMLIIHSSINNGESAEEWMQYIRDSPGQYNVKVPMSMQNLGSDLHTTTADADADVTRDGLATRLDRLRDF